MSNYNVERDIRGWPKGLPEEERKALTYLIAIILENAKVPLPLYRIEEMVRWKQYEDLPTFNKGSLTDWRMACVERATEIVADAVYVLQDRRYRLEEK